MQSAEAETGAALGSHKPRPVITVNIDSDASTVLLALHFHKEMMLSSACLNVYRLSLLTVGTRHAKK